MTRDQLKKNVVRSTVSSYFRILLRMVLGLVTFRLLYQGLELRGVRVLVPALGDLRLRHPARLRTRLCRPEAGGRIVRAPGLGSAQPGAQHDLLLSPPQRRSLRAARHCVCSGPMLIPLPCRRRTGSFRTHPEVFLIGTGIAFPLGFFPEVLQGQQRITTANNVSMVSMLANFAAVRPSSFQAGVHTLVMLALLCILIPYVGAAWLCPPAHARRPTPPAVLLPIRCS
jgi:hypothetical protein